MDQERIVAIGLLTEQELNLLGPAFKWAWPIEAVPQFDELIRAIDEADEQLRGTSRKAEEADQ